MTTTILSLQTVTTAPQSVGVSEGTNLLLPPSRVIDRLGNFPDDVWDLRPHSHLVRLMSVLLGDAGAGQLNKRFFVSRLSDVLAGSGFFDLDGFYGALFGFQRTQGEEINLNPYTGLATVKQWIQAYAADSSYRSRLFQFAKAINFGGTPIGLELVAEAMLGVDVDLYEGWVDDDHASIPTFPMVFLTRHTPRNMFLLRPKKQISAADGYNLRRVVNTLKPADTFLNIDFVGADIHNQVPIGGIVASSEHWEIVQYRFDRALGKFAEILKPPFSGHQGESWSYATALATVSASTEELITLPSPSTEVEISTVGYGDPYAGFPLTFGVFVAAEAMLDFHVGYGETYGGIFMSREIPVTSQGVLDIFVGYGQVYGGISTRVLTVAPPVPGGGGGTVQVLQIENLPIQRWGFFDSSYLDYPANNALISPRNVLAARAVSDGVLVAHPYSSDRVTTTASLSPVYADGYPLSDLASLLGTSAVERPPGQSFWVTPQRKADSPFSEVIEAQYIGPEMVNRYAFEVAHYPQKIEGQYLDPTGKWVTLFTYEITDSNPSYIAPVDVRDEHPDHPSNAPGHWVSYEGRIPPTMISAFRLRLTRIPGTAPVDFDGKDRSYSLAVRNFDLGYEVLTLADAVVPGIDNTFVPAQTSPTTPLATIKDVLGNPVQFFLETFPAHGALDQLNFWVSEPQPVGDAIVALYIDTRDSTGAPQVIDRFLLDPLFPGSSVNLYWSNSVVPPSGLSFYDSLAWTPVPRSFGVQKGWLYLPPTRASYWKFEFTNLVAQPYEAMFEFARTPRRFPPAVAGQIPPTDGPGQSTDVIDPGLQVQSSVAESFDANAVYLDGLLAQVARTSKDIPLTPPTTTLFADTPQGRTATRDQSWLYGFIPWANGSQASRFDRVGIHAYDTTEVAHREKVAFFVGMGSISAYRINYEIDDDTEVFIEHFYDQLGIATDTWNFGPGLHSDDGPVPMQATSTPIRSFHPIRAIQFATIQSDPIQLLPDDSFSDPTLASWSAYGDASLTYDQTTRSVIIRRHPATMTHQLSDAHSPVNTLVHPTFDYRTQTVPITPPITPGGIQSGVVVPSQRGRIYAAARIFFDSDLSAPVKLQIVDANNEVLAEEVVTGNRGQMVETYIGHTLGDSALVPPPGTPPTWPQFGPRGLIRPPVTPLLTDTPLVRTGASAGTQSGSGTLADDSRIKVRVIQDTLTTDSWRLGALSLFDDGILWEFSIDGGSSFFPALQIRNNAEGVLSFPSGATMNSLVWKATAYQKNRSVSALKIRPLYSGVVSARTNAVQRGPNYSTWDHFYTTDGDPEFNDWTLPIPKQWFLAYKPYPILQTA
jgi:hypothetical protein